MNDGEFIEFLLSVSCAVADLVVECELEKNIHANDKLSTDGAETTVAHQHR